MLVNKYMSGLLRALRTGGVAIPLAALVACGGDQPVGPGSSSSSASNSSLFSSSSSLAASSSSVSLSSSAPSLSSSSSSSIRSSSVSSTASSGSAFTSARIQAQNYTNYLELGSQREGAQTGPCAQGVVDLVDTTDQNGVCAIGYVWAGEWVEYALPSVPAGTYNLVFRVSSATARNSTVSINGRNVGQFTTAGSGWNSYHDRAINNVAIGAGNNTLRVTFDQGETNLNYFDLVLVSQGSVSVPSSSVSSIASSRAVSSSSSALSSSSRASSSSLSSSSRSSTISSSSSLSSSSRSSSSSVSSSSSSAGNPGDVEAGRTEFNQRCGTCHNHQGNGVFTALTSPSFNMAEVLTRRTFDGAVQYTVASMPLGNPGSCVGNCALNTVAYMASLVSNTPTPPPPPPTASACSVDTALSYGPRTVRLLTAREFRNSLVDLGLVLESEFKDEHFAPDNRHTKSGYPVHTLTSVDETRLNALTFAAEQLAGAAATRLRQSTGCGTNATNCATSFLTLAQRMFRRPLDTQEQNLYRAFFTEYGAQDGMELAVTAAMTSAQFLYRSELGIPVAEARQRGINIGTLPDGRAKLNAADSNAYVLDSYEMATALAYMYTGSTPDTMLMQAAANNQLNTEAQLRTQITRLIATQRGRQHMAEFGANWMRADDVLRAQRPGVAVFTDQIKQDMAREVRELFSHVFFTDTVPFEEFYSGNFAVVNRRLAQYYGSNASWGDNEWRVTQIPNRGGIITTGAFMTSTSNPELSGPIKRAVGVRELMLCHHIGAPPADIASDQTRVQLQQQVQNRVNEGTLTSREYFELVTDSPACASCHATMINPLFGMDDFDEIGRFRTTMRGMGANGVNGLTVDSSGELIGLESVYDISNRISFNGSKDLGQKIANLPAVRECYIINSFRYATGLPLDADSYSTQSGGQIDEPVELGMAQQMEYNCVKEQLRDEYINSNSNPRRVYEKIGTLDLIRLRKPIDKNLIN